MVCCTYIDSPERERATIVDDDELLKLLDEVNAGSDHPLLIGKRVCRYRKWFREKERHLYTLYLQTFAPEYQMINFGPEYEPWPEDRIAFCFEVSRQAVSGFLFGVLYARSNRVKS